MSILGGFAQGLGDGLVEMARNRREDFLRSQDNAREDSLRAEDDVRRAAGGGRGGGGGGGGRGGRTDENGDSFDSISRGMTGDITTWGREQGLDDPTINSFIVEVERIRGTQDVTENQAWQMVLNGANRASSMQESGGGLFGGPRVSEVVDGPFDGTFTYTAPVTPTVPGGGASLPGLGVGDPSTQTMTPPATPFSNPSGGITQRSEAEIENDPQPGDVLEGYRFKGGNPNDSANWELI